MGLLDDRPCLEQSPILYTADVARGRGLTIRDGSILRYSHGGTLNPDSELALYLNAGGDNAARVDHVPLDTLDTIQSKYFYQYFIDLHSASYTWL